MLDWKLANNATITLSVSIGIDMALDGGYLKHQETKGVGRHFIYLPPHLYILSVFTEFWGLGQGLCSCIVEDINVPASILLSSIVVAYGFGDGETRRFSLIK